MTLDEHETLKDLLSWSSRMIQEHATKAQRAELLAGWAVLDTLIEEMRGEMDFERRECLADAEMDR